MKKGKNARMKKRLCESDADRISRLPDDAIQRILALLPIKDAAKTATLSKQWRQHWRANTQFVFDCDFGRISKEGNYALNVSKLMFEICKALMVHDGPITKFVLDIPGLRRPSPDIDPMVHFLCKKGIQELALIFDDEINDGHRKTEREMMPSVLFSACQLNSLELQYCDFLRIPSWFQGFSKLTHLELISVNVSSNFYSDFLPKCPLLRDLKLFTRDSAAVESQLTAELVAPSLEVLESNVWNLCFKHTPLLSVVWIVPVDEKYKVSNFRAYNPDIVAVFAALPAIQELTVGAELLLFFATGDVPLRLSSHLHELKVLKLPNIILHCSSEASVLVCLIMSSPNLHKLSIRSSDDPELPPTEVIDKLQLLLEAEDAPCASYFQLLEKFKLVGCRGTQVELDLVRFVLTSAPRLMRTVIQLYDELDSRKGLKFLTEVTRYKRASTEAEVIYVWNEENGTS